MLRVSRDYREGFLDQCKQEFKNGGIIIPFTNFLENLLQQKKDLKDRIESEYPKVIKLPKSPIELAKGDFEPSRVITIDRPPTWHGLPIWTESSLKAIELQCGYLNGDKRALSDFTLNGKQEAHMIAGGRTGSGKSVFLNDLIFSACFLYAPWELNLWMSDSKIVEFKRYADSHHIPHIKVIAATGDSGYILSMLEGFYNSMIQIQDGAFSKAGVQNLEDFRKTTGLTMPRNLLIMDEFQTALKTGGKRAPKITEYIDLIGRLGRSMGYHMCLASQEVAQEVKPILGNIPIRFCLNSTAAVSNMLLGNDQGHTGDVGMGKVYVTKEEGPDKNNNYKFNVPFQSMSEFEEMGKFLEDEGKKVGYWLDTNSYDEGNPIYEEEMDKLIATKNPTDLVIGVPSFLNKDTAKFSIECDCTDFQNILIFSPSSELVNRQVRSLYRNAVYDKENDLARHRYLVADEKLLEHCEVTPDYVDSVNQITSTSDKIWEQTLWNIGIRMMVIEGDAMAFDNPVYDDQEAFDMLKSFDDLEIMKNPSPINVSRAHYFKQLFLSDRYLERFGLNGRGVDQSTIDAYCPQFVKQCFNMICNLSSNFISDRVTKKDFKPVYYHLVGYGKVRGLGRAGRNYDRFVNLLMDCYSCNATFILYTTTTDGLSDIMNGVRFELLDNAGAKCNVVKCPDYPNQVSPRCVIFFDKANDVLRSVKKLFEILE